MHITTMHTLAFTFRAANGRYQLAENIISSSADVVGVTLLEFKALPLPNGEDAAMRTSQVQVCSDNLDRLENYWNELQRGLALVGVEATSP